MTISKRVNQIFGSEPDIDGIVITQGTNAVEETAYFLNLTVNLTKTNDRQELRRIFQEY